MLSFDITTERATERSNYEINFQRPAQSQQLSQSQHCDICIIGGGLTGITCALECLQAGYKPILLESNLVGWGASGRNGGQFIHGYAAHNLNSIVKQTGKDMQFLNDCADIALTEFIERIEHHKIDCDLQMGYLDVADRAKQFNQLRSYAQELNNPKLRILNNQETIDITGSSKYYGALEDLRSGQVNPLKLTVNLAKRYVELGGILYERSKVLNLRKQNNKHILEVAPTETNNFIANQQKSLQITADYVVVACGAFCDKLLPSISGYTMPVSTFIAATEPLDKEQYRDILPQNHCVCDVNVVLDYFRKNKQNQLCFGGRANYNASIPKNLPQIMRQRMLAVYPQLANLAFSEIWGGYVSITMSRFFHIGKIEPTIYFAQGFSGHGLVLTGFAGKIIAQSILQQSSTFDAFSKIQPRKFFGGKHLRSPLLMLGMLYYNLKDRL